MAPYALVTGASAGLGTLFAHALAREGRSLVLVARRAERLDSIATEIRAAHTVTVKTIAMDLSAAHAPESLFSILENDGILIDTLINNAGFGARGAFIDIDLAMQAEMVDLNCRTVMALCHRALPAMIERGDGAILNLASVAAFLPGPYMSTYYATKAFVLSLSQALHEEVKDKGVRVCALCPGPTNTEFASVAGLTNSSLFKVNVADAATVVQDGMAALRANKAVEVSGLSNKLLIAALRLAPRSLARRIAMRVQKGRR